MTTQLSRLGIAPNVGIFASARVLWADDVLGMASHEAWLRQLTRQIGGQWRYLTADRQLIAHPPRFGLPVRPLPTATAMLLRNCWIAQCPWCAGQEGIWRPTAAEPDWFYCCGCGNRATAGERITLAWQRDALAVERIVHARPLAHTRGWLPGETLADLRAENVAHDLPPEAAL